MSSISTDGWDMIASATQGALNDVLEQYFDTHPITFDREIQVGSTKMSVGVDCMIGPIQLNALKQGLTIMDVKFPIETGTFTYPVRNSQPLDGMSVIVEIALTYVQSELQPTGDGTNYDFILDFTNPDAFQKVKLENLPAWLESNPMMVAMVELAMVYALAQWAAANPKVTICTVTLGAASSEYPALVPSQAFYSFNLNESDPDQTPLSILMLTMSAAEGQFNTGTNYIPPSCNSSLLVSENVLLSGILLPAVAQAFGTSTSNFTVSGSKLSLNSPVNVTDENGTSLEITSFSLDVAGNALNISMAATHDFFMGIGMNVTASGSMAFEVSQPENGEQTISLVVSDEPTVKLTPDLPSWLTWATWIFTLFLPFIGIFVGLAMLIYEGIIFALGAAANQKVSSSFVGYSLKQVAWANTQWLEIESIDLPGGVQVGANLAPNLTTSTSE